MVKKRRTFPLFRSVKAQMVERYIFNFRIKPKDLRQKLPVHWLEPHSINGWSVVSFCILWLEKITISPFPAIFPYNTISCAYRIGVTDKSGNQPKPSVYITDRFADLSLIARLAPWILLDTIPMVKAAIGHFDGGTHVQMSHPDGRHLFSAETHLTAKGLKSEVFENIEDFAKFIKDGVSSYAPSIYPDAYSKVDLLKEDVRYEPLDANVEHSALNAQWADAGMVFDSAVRATGALYKWTYRGLWY